MSIICENTNFFENFSVKSDLVYGEKEMYQSQTERAGDSLKLPALWANVMVCGYLRRFVSFRAGLIAPAPRFSMG